MGRSSTSDWEKMHQFGKKEIGNNNTVYHNGKKKCGRRKASVREEKGFSDCEKKECISQGRKSASDCGKKEGIS